VNDSIDATPEAVEPAELEAEFDATHCFCAFAAGACALAPAVLPCTRSGASRTVRNAASLLAPSSLGTVTLVTSAAVNARSRTTFPVRSRPSTEPSWRSGFPCQVAAIRVERGGAPRPDAEREVLETHPPRCFRGSSAVPAVSTTTSATAPPPSADLRKPHGLPSSTRK
jgi:hypothetical protein